MRPVAIVLYEDSLAGKRFVPHDLVLACVADRKPGASVWTLKHEIEAIPRNGAGNVKTDLGAGLFGARGESVLAVFDRDHISDPNAFPACGSCLSAIRGAIATVVHASIVSRFTAVLLDKNMETVVEACCSVQSKPAPKAKPNPADRDKLIAPVAYDDSPARRAQVLTQVPSFKYLVEKLELLV